MLIQVNAIGTLWLNDLLMPKMVARGSGSIILISSVGGGVTQFAGFNYADGMSKAAIAFLGRTLAADLTHTGVEVFTICIFKSAHCCRKRSILALECSAP